MEDKDLILLLINQLEYVRGKTRLQKLLFLLTSKFNLKNNLNFQPNRYGPFSSNLNEEIKNLMDQGLIKETNDRESKELGYLYTINDQKQEEINKKIAKMDSSVINKLHEIVEEFGKMPLNKLLKYVYQRYPEFTTKSLWRGEIYE